MVVEAKRRVLSNRAAGDIIDCIDIFRRGQIALPSQTEALRVLVRMGLEKWREQDGMAYARDSASPADSRPAAGATVLPCMTDNGGSDSRPISSSATPR